MRPEADFDAIVENDLARETLTDLDLMPSAWDLPEDEQRRILHRGVSLLALPTLDDSNWPVFENNGLVTFAADAFVSSGLSRDQAIATLLHEIGHRVNPLPYMEAITAELSKIGADQATKPPNRDELFADDYVRHCGYSKHLLSALRLLTAEHESFQTRSTTDRITRLESDGQPRLLNLTPLPN